MRKEDEEWVEAALEREGVRPVPLETVEAAIVSWVPEVRMEDGYDEAE